MLLASHDGRNESYWPENHTTNQIHTCMIFNDFSSRIYSCHKIISCYDFSDVQRYIGNCFQQHMALHCLFCVDRPLFCVDRPLFCVDRPLFCVDRPLFCVDRPLFCVDRPLFCVDRPLFCVDRPHFCVDRPLFCVNRPLFPQFLQICIISF